MSIIPRRCTLAQLCCARVCTERPSRPHAVARRDNAMDRQRPPVAADTSTVAADASRSLAAATTSAHGITDLFPWAERPRDMSTPSRRRQRTAERPLRVGVAPANAQIIHVPSGGERCAELLGVVWDGALRAHWLPHTADHAKAVRKLQTDERKRGCGILGRASAPGSSAPSTTQPSGLASTRAPSHSRRTCRYRNK